MGSVKYSLNGKKFEDYDAYVGQSHGLVDKLERKPVMTHDWPEYNGRQYDLAVSPKYKERIITLDMFVMGNDWDAVTANLNAILDELDKPGTQRLVVEPFNYKPLVFDVIQDGAVNVQKRFEEGFNFCTFSLGLMEPEPVKRVFKKGSGSFTMNYESDQNTAVNIDGSRTDYNDSNVSVSETLGSGTHYITVIGDVYNLTTNADEII